MIKISGSTADRGTGGIFLPVPWGKACRRFCYAFFHPEGWAEQECHSVIQMVDQEGQVQAGFSIPAAVTEAYGEEGTFLVPKEDVMEDEACNPAEPGAIIPG